jgi:hypothetical protein
MSASTFQIVLLAVSLSHARIAVADSGLAQVATQRTAAAALRRDAALRFDAGVRFAQAGNFQRAVDEFRAAYALSPHYSVLYNLGVAYVELGYHKRAAETLEKFLLDGSKEVSQERAAVVTATILDERGKLGSVAVRVEPPDTQLTLDGEKIRASIPVAVDPGRHIVVAQAEGYVTLQREIDVARHGQIDLQLTLRARRTVLLACPLPDVNVLLQGRVLATTSGTEAARLELPEQASALTLKRAGYRTQHLGVTAETKLLRCEMTPEEPSAWLQVTASEPGAQIFVDGSPSPVRRVIVPGRHLVEVKLDGFQDNVQLVHVTPGEEGARFVSLTPTELFRRQYEARTFGLRIASYSAVVGAVALGSVGGGILYSNTRRNDTWVDQGRQESTRGDLERSVKRTDGYAYWMLGAGAVLLGTGVTLYFTGGAPERYAYHTLSVGPRGIFLGQSF